MSMRRRPLYRILSYFQNRKEQPLVERPDKKDERGGSNPRDYKKKV